MSKGDYYKSINQTDIFYICIDFIYMNLQQLEYIVAVDELRHFVKAAERCCVTQPTLSMMIQRLEDELGIKLFDRSKQPVVPTPDGQSMISRARIILSEVQRMKEFAGELRGGVSGEIKLAVIPTLAPYLVPLFIQRLIEAYPALRVMVKEMTTSQAIEQLKASQIDIALLATPLNEKQLKEHFLFHEEFLAYSSWQEPALDKVYVLPSDIDVNQLWLLEEGHCFRNQVLNFCELRRKDAFLSRLQYEAGSIETLLNLVDVNQGITIVPLMATLQFTRQRQQKLRRFVDPKPVREISLVVHVNFSRNQVLKAIREEIIRAVPAHSFTNKRVLAI